MSNIMAPYVPPNGVKYWPPKGKGYNCPLDVKWFAREKTMDWLYHVRLLWSCPSSD